MSRSLVTVETVQRRLQGLTNTQESIETTSLWVFHHVDSIRIIVDCWLNLFRAGQDEQRITLFYLMNDVVQRAKKKHIENINLMFEPVVISAVNIGRASEKVRAVMTRCVKLIADCRGFSHAALDRMNRAIEDPNEIEDAAAYIDNVELSKKIDCFVRSVSTVNRAYEAVENGNIDFTAQIQIRMKDKREGQQLLSDARTAHDKIIRLKDTMGIHLKFIYELIETVENAKRFYQQQLRDVSFVEDAYVKYGQGIREVQEELNDMITTGVYPAASPPRDAPSPGPDEDIFAAGVEQALNHFRPATLRDNLEAADMDMDDDDGPSIPIIPQTGIQNAANATPMPYPLSNASTAAANQYSAAVIGNDPRNDIDSFFATLANCSAQRSRPVVGVSQSQQPAVNRDAAAATLSPAASYPATVPRGNIPGAPTVVAATLTPQTNIPSTVGSASDQGTLAMQARSIPTVSTGVQNPSQISMFLKNYTLKPASGNAGPELHYQQPGSASSSLVSPVPQQSRFGEWAPPPPQPQMAVQIPPASVTRTPEAISPQVPCRSLPWSQSPRPTSATNVGVTQQIPSIGAGTTHSIPLVGAGATHSIPLVGVGATHQISPVEAGQPHRIPSVGVDTSHPITSVGVGTPQRIHSVVPGTPQQIPSVGGGTPQQILSVGGGTPQQILSVGGGTPQRIPSVGSGTPQRIPAVGVGTSQPSGYSFGKPKPIPTVAANPGPFGYFTKVDYAPQQNSFQDTRGPPKTTLPVTITDYDAEAGGMGDTDERQVYAPQGYSRGGGRGGGGYGESGRRGGGYAESGRGGGYPRGGGAGTIRGGFDGRRYTNSPYGGGRSYNSRGYQPFPPRGRGSERGAPFRGGGGFGGGGGAF